MNHVQVILNHDYRQLRESQGKVGSVLKTKNLSGKSLPSWEGLGVGEVQACLCGKSHIFWDCQSTQSQPQLACKGNAKRFS